MSQEVTESLMEHVLGIFQKELHKWKMQNFADSTGRDQFLGVVEEVGELSHALLKMKQGIRGSEEQHIAEAKDAVGDILIYMFNMCSEFGWDVGPILTETWDEVSRRDWIQNPENGKIND